MSGSNCWFDEAKKGTIELEINPEKTPRKWHRDLKHGKSKEEVDIKGETKSSDSYSPDRM